MACKRELIYTPNAEEDLREIMDYLVFEFGSETLERFLLKVKDFNEIIVSQPRVFAYFIKTKNIYKHSISKSFFLYQVTRKTVFVIAILDGRMNPKAIKKVARKRL